MAEVEHRHCPITCAIDRLRGVVLADVVTEHEAWRENCRAVFEGFQACVNEHIAYDRSGGLHEKLRAAGPTHARRVDALEAEHDRLSEQCAAIAETLSQADASDVPAARALVCQLENIIAVFHRHTAAERSLIGALFDETATVASVTGQAERFCRHRQENLQTP